MKKPTIEQLKKANRIFFSKESIGFHKDEEYEIISEDGKWVLVVKQPRRKNVFYYINKSNFLNYKRQGKI